MFNLGKVVSKMESNVISVGQIYKNNYKPEKTAILFKDTKFTFVELDDKVRAFANFLKGKGVTKGDKVMLDEGNSPEFLFSYLGTVRNAAVIVPINPMLTLEELKYIASDSEAKYLIINEGVTQKEGYSKEALEQELGLTVFVLNEEMRAEIENAPREDYDMITDMKELSTLLYTSGTTGRPKAAMLTHYNLVANSWQSKVAFETTEDDIFMCVLPIFHVFAFTAAILVPLFVGGTVDIVESFQPKVVVNNLLHNKISVFLGVPAMYIVLTEEAKKSVKFPDLRLAISGGAALPVEVYHQAKETFDIPIAEGYGLTESSPVSIVNPPSGIQKPGSIGVTLPEVECIIADENDCEVPTGEIGEILMKGPNIMSGYYNRPEETAETLRNGWLHTGDIAKRDEDGYIYIVDRKKDIVNVAGLNIYPREIEEVLYKHPKIKDAAVVGVKDNLRGEAVTAYIVLKEGAEAYPREILRWLKTLLANFKIPRHLIIVESLPRNSSGKILKRMLRENTDF